MIALYICAGALGVVLLYILFLFLCSLFIAPDKEYEKNSRFYRALLNFNSWAALKILGVKLHIVGVEMVPESGRVLFVGNHISNYDPIVTWCVFKEHDIAFISKGSNFNIPVFGRFIRKCCFMTIDREDPRKALKTLNRASELIKNDEVSVGVYPEGTRSRTGELLPFHDGVFRIAVKANVPVAVIKLSGTNEIHRNFFRRRSHVYLEVTDVIPAEEAKTLGTRGISCRVRAALTEGIENKKSDRIEETV